MPKLGKILDLNKCYEDDNHWTHSELKEDQLYIVRYEGNWFLGDFTHWCPPYATFWQFNPVWGARKIQLSYGKPPIEDGWKHIQEFIGNDVMMKTEKISKDEIKQKMIQNKKDINELQSQLGVLHRYEDYLVKACSLSGHIIVPRDKKSFDETGSTSAVCEVCGKDFGWYCPDSPDHYCHYENNSESCIYCGQPEERK